VEEDDRLALSPFQPAEQRLHVLVHDDLLVGQ